MDVKAELLEQIERLNEGEAKWLLNIAREIHIKGIKRKLLNAATKGVLRVPVKVQRKRVEPVKGKGKTLSEIVIEDRR